MILKYVKSAHDLQKQCGTINLVLCTHIIYSSHKIEICGTNTLLHILEDNAESTKAFNLDSKICIVVKIHTQQTSSKLQVNAPSQKQRSLYIICKMYIWQVECNNELGIFLRSFLSFRFTVLLLLQQNKKCINANTSN